MKKIIVVGAGGRGTVYSEAAKKMDGEFQVVAVAEPIDIRRNWIKQLFDIPEEMCHTSWEDLLSRPKFADVVVIATMDRDHLAPALAAIEKGYDLLLEKPMSATPEECLQIERAAKKAGVTVLVCHVLRYTPFFNALKNLIDSGKIGKIIHIQHAECVGNIHYAHSFIRGNWGNSQKSSCMILQKSCHDMDILCYLTGKKCKRVSSFGELTYFKEENAPQGAPLRCTDGCPHADTCYYNAKWVYLEHGRGKFMTRALLKKKDIGTDEEIIEALKTSPYGRCVFRCDNDVVDHQTVNLEFEDGITVSFTMAAFNYGGRYIRIMGTDGELSASMSDDFITFFDFATRTYTQIPIADAIVGASMNSGHGGGDTGIMRALADKLNGREADICDLRETYISHLIAFAAEESRLTGKVIDMEEFEERIEKS